VLIIEQGSSHFEGRKYVLYYERLETFDIYLDLF